MYMSDGSDSDDLSCAHNSDSVAQYTTKLEAQTPCIASSLSSQGQAKGQLSPKYNQSLLRFFITHVPIKTRSNVTGHQPGLK